MQQNESRHEKSTGIRPPPHTVERLQIGSGPVALAGWSNVDCAAYPGVDYVLDVTQGLPFTGVRYIFAEHFLEHLSLKDALTFLKECRRVLAPEGILRLSTPNLDWVYETHYHPPLHGDLSMAVTECLILNRAFRGWGHQFLYNREMLEKALRHAGFSSIQFCAYGESDHKALRGLERHDRSPDSPSLPHVLIAEASGEGAPASLEIAAFRDYLRDIELR